MDSDNNKKEIKDGINEIKQYIAVLDKWISDHKFIKFLIVLIFILSWGYSMVMVGRHLQCSDLDGYLMKTKAEGFICVNAETIDEFNELNNIVNRELDLPANTLNITFWGG